MTLKLASKLELPNDAVTQTFLILGKRGSGKTNTAVVLAEEMIKLAPIVVLDPIDAWWGLKSSFEGDKPGLGIYVFGGRHPDLPLDPHTGELMARLFIEHRISMILSMKGWTVSDRARFVTDFVTYLLNHNNRVPVHVVLEEADAFIPQRPQPDEAKMLGATDRLIRWGRMDGIGATAISQRSAAINKNTTTQAETLIVHRTIGPQDRDAVLEWIKFHGTQEERDTVMTELPHLKDGEAYVWSPEWLHILSRVFIRRRHTFDSAATPKVGEKMITPKELSKVDLERISGQLQTVIDHAKLDDPRELRKKILELQQKVHALETTAKVQMVEKIVEVAKTPEEVRGLLTFFIKYAQDVQSLLGASNILQQRAQDALELPQQWEVRPGSGAGLAQTTEQRVVNPMVDGTGSHMRDKPRQAPLQVAPTHTVSVTRLHDLTTPQQRILDALAWLDAISYAPEHPHHWTIVAMLASQSPKSSGFANNVSVLRVAGLVEGNRGSGLTLTVSGAQAAATPEVVLTNQELHDAIASKLTTPQTKILRFLVRNNAPTLDRWEKVAERSDQSPTSSGFANNVSVLRSMGLVRGNRGTGLEATSILFLNGRR